MKGIKNMRVLRINNNRGEFIVKPLEIIGTINDSNYKTIDLIEKEDVLDILEYCLDNDVEMDEYNKDLLPNPVHQIIYENLYAKLEKVIKSKESIKQEVDAQFSAAELKYNCNQE